MYNTTGLKNQYKITVNVLRAYTPGVVRTCIYKQQYRVYGYT